MGGGFPKMSYCQRDLLNLLSLFLFPSLPPESYFNYSETAGKATGGNIYSPLVTYILDIASQQELSDTLDVKITMPWFTTVPLKPLSDQ